MKAIYWGDARQWLVAAWLSGMVFVFPIPHTVALRNAFLLVGMIALLWTCRKSLPRLPLWLKPAAWWLIALTAWIVFHSVAVSPSPTFALDQFRANWVMPLLLGTIAAWAATQLTCERALQAVTIALAAHMLWLLGWQFRIWLNAGGWPFKATPFGSYDFQGTLNTFLFALLLADRLCWTLRKYSPLALSPHFGWALLLLSLVSDLALQSRNSTIISLVLLVAATLTLANAQIRHRRLVFVGLGVVALLGVGSATFDQRWQGLRESATIGWTSTDLTWLTTDEYSWQQAKWPVTASGKPLEFSAYFRAAMARQSVDFITDHPLGVGFGHDAFGRAIERKYGHSGLGSSHSGWLDFALGTGVIGLGLLLIASSLAIRSGWQRFRQRQDMQGLLLAFFVGGYMLRCLLDGHLSGWRLGLFAFITGVLVGAPSEEPEAP